MQLDAVVFGGGAAGLWMLDELVQHGCSTVLLESGQLGQGQTVASQGIIHGGLKYTLKGLLTRSARSIREMPAVWRECLESRREPDLSETDVRAQFCHLWRTDSFQSRLGMFGAKYGLRVKPKTLAPSERPEVLARCPGDVARLDEQVIAPASFIANLANRHRKRILAIDAENGLAFTRNGGGDVDTITLRNPLNNERIEIQPRHVVLAAGAGNMELRRRLGLTVPVMQRRPLHMVLARGDLPALNGHCMDANRTRVTIVTDTDSAGRTVWQIGGQIAEDGVALDERSLMQKAQSELEACIPGINLSEVEWTTYRVDRAEAVTRTGKRPESFQVLRDDNILTTWPTKLALVPRLARDVVRAIPARATPLMFETLATKNWPRPEVARPPWETITAWHRLTEPTPPLDRELVA